MKSRSSGHALHAPAAGRGATTASREGHRRNEGRFRRLFETAQDGILILDGSTHKILEANPLIAELLGCSRDELIGKDLFAVGILPDRQRAADILRRLHESGCVRFEHSQSTKRPGPVRELEFVCNEYQENGKSLIQCNIRDIADRKEAERRLREALQQLAAAKEELEIRVLERTADLQQRNAELEAFSYSLSHDLRAPIRAIVSFTEIALGQYAEAVGPPATDYLAKAIGAAQRLDHLIMDVLAFSKTTREGIRFERVDVERLLRDILQERVEWAPPKAQIKIETPLLAVIGDRASLTQCLTNLIDNAVKFVPLGVVPDLRIFTESIEGKVRLCVQDNGIGVPEGAQARVFDLFQRAHNGYEGHGIGLAIVRRAAERMGGRVGLISEPGRGSTFWVELAAASDLPGD